MGIYFSCNREEAIKQNFHGTLGNVQKTINLWKLRSLSLQGKVTIIKSFLIPKFLYASSILETPPGIFEQMEKVIFKFLWRGPDKVKRVVVINSLNNGGLDPSLTLKRILKH